MLIVHKDLSFGFFYCTSFQKCQTIVEVLLIYEKTQLKKTHTFKILRVDYKNGTGSTEIFTPSFQMYIVIKGKQNLRIPFPNIMHCTLRVLI